MSIAQAPGLRAAETTESAEAERSWSSSLVRWGVGLAAGLALWFAPLPGLSPKAEHGAALIVATVLWWLLRAAPQGVIGLLFVALVILLGVDASGPLLTQAWTSSNIWFVFASFGFGLVVANTSLGERMTYGLLRYFTRSFWGFGLFVIVAGAVLSFIGMAGDFGRMGILLPMIGVVAGAASRAGRVQSTKAMAMMMLAVNQPTLMYVYNGFWLNQTFLGLAHQRLDYLGWITHFLVPSLLVSLLGLVAVRILFPDRIEVPREVCDERLRALGPLGAQDYRLLGFLALAVVLWVTSTWTHLDPGWIALVVMVLMLIPEAGVVRFQDFLASINWNIVFFLTGAFALGSLVKDLHLAGTVERLIVPSSLPHDPIVFGLFVSVWSMIIHLFAGDAASSMAVTVPVFTHAAASFHLNPLPYGFIAYMSIFSQYFFIFQGAGVVFAYGYGMFTARDVFKLGVASFVYTALALGVLGVVYWRLLGML
jgi:di/tricarboxylate transporter